MRHTMAVSMVVTVTVASAHAQDNPALDVYNQALETCNELFRNDPAAYRVCIDQAAATKALVSGYGGGAATEELRNNALKVAKEASTEANRLLGDAFKDVDCSEFSQTLEDSGAYRLCAGRAPHFGARPLNSTGGGVKAAASTARREALEEQVAAVETFVSEDDAGTSWEGLGGKAADAVKDGFAAAKVAASGAVKNFRRKVRNKVKSVVAVPGSLVNDAVDWARGRNMGDDSGLNARNGQCNDRRFVGNDVAAFSDAGEAEMGRDATDCRKLLREGRIRWRNEPPAKRKGAPQFGNDLGESPYDGYCDDGRFMGPGMGGTTEVKKDATDCRMLYKRGLIMLRPLPE